MTRLADRILATRLTPPSWSGELATQEKMRKETALLHQQILQAEIIEASNVAEYFFTATNKDVLDWRIERDYPCLAPPFPLLWLEMKRPSKLVSERRGTRSSSSLVPCRGFLVEGFDAKSVESFDTGGIARDWARLGGSILAKFSDPKNGDLALKWLSLTREEKDLLGRVQMEGLRGRSPVPELATWTEGLRWILRIGTFAELEKGKVRGPMGQWVIGVGTEGQVLGIPGFELRYYGATDDSQLGQAYWTVYHSIHPALLAIALMHCKNVEILATELEVKLSQAHAKRHGRPLVRFHTLNITPMKEVLKREGRAEETGLRLALHICRGHFKDYRGGAGLFGRLQGLFWWDAHVRGSLKEGVVVKDYSVNRPGA